MENDPLNQLLKLAAFHGVDQNTLKNDLEFCAASCSVPVEYIAASLLRLLAIDENTVIAEGEL